MAIESAWIFPLNHGGSFHTYGTVYQRVSCCIHMTQMCIGGIPAVQELLFGVGTTTSRGY